VLGAAAILALLALVGGARGASCTKTWNGGSGAWETPSDWTPSGVPGSGDSVCITASGTYTVTLDENTSVASLIVGTAGSGTQTLEVQPSKGLALAASSQIEADCSPGVKPSICGPPATCSSTSKPT
jgi:hypothetical protein